METVIWYLLTETACDSPYSGGMVCLEKRYISKMDDLLIKTCFSLVFYNKRYVFFDKGDFLEEYTVGDNY